jgi:hypothetical protein
MQCAQAKLAKGRDVDVPTDEEIFPWPIPDLLNHGKSLHLQHDINPTECTVKSDDENCHGLDSSLELLEAGSIASSSSDVKDIDNNSSVTLDPRTLCLERPNGRRHRDSIALRKSKLRRTPTADAVLRCHIRSQAQSQSQSAGQIGSS